jgi:cytochrome c peroxidase
MRLSILRMLGTLAALVGAALAVQSAPEPAATSAPTPVNVPDLRAKAKEILGILPDKMPGGESDTPEQVELGRKLYFDTRLSANQTQSCNTCHAVDNNRAGVDSEPTSPGAFGKRGNRNSPTTLNAGFHFAQFWDGRAATLEEQAKGPILNPIEMAMASDKEVLQRIRAVGEYQTLFAKAFPNAAEKITYDNLARTIAAFERTLVTHDRFNDFLKGDDRALSAEELKGLDLFLEIGCTTCHNGPLVGATTFQKAGLINPYENTQDLGRFDVTKDESDQFKFKVPSLRNVALTHPYFHDGAVGKLEDAVTKMAWMQLGRKLEPAETQALVAFLQSLSDKQRGAAHRKTVSAR